MGPDPVVAPVTAADLTDRPGGRQPGDRQGAGNLGGAARHSVLNLLGVAVAAVLGFALNVVVTRAWSKPDAGLFFSATSAFMLLLTGSRLGTGVGSVYFVSRYRALGRIDRLRASLISGVVPVLLVGCVLAVAGYLATPWLADLITRRGGPQVENALRVLVVFLPVAALGDVALSACRGFGRMRPLITIDRIGRPIAQFAGVLLVALAGLSASFALPLAWVLPYLPAGIVAAFWLAVMVRRAERSAGVVPVPARSELGPYWRYTGPRAAGSVAQMTVQRLDIVLVGALRGLSEAAVYAAATRFMVFGQLSAQALSTAVQHRFADLLARDDRAGAGRLYQTVTAWLVLITWPLYLVFAIFANELLKLFGDGYNEGRSVTVLLALTMLVATACGMVDEMLNMAGKTALTFINAMLGLVVNVSLNLLLIPEWGMLGAAIAWSATRLVTNLVPVTQLAVTLKLHPFGRGTLLAALLSAACFGVPPLAGRLMIDDSLPVLIASTLIGGLVYLAGLWHWRRAFDLGALRAMRRRPKQAVDAS